MIVTAILRFFGDSKKIQVQRNGKPVGGYTPIVVPFDGIQIEGEFAAFGRPPTDQ